MRYILTTLALLLALSPAAARADAPLAWQHKALAEAQLVWHPTCGQLRLVFTTTHDGAIGEAALGGCDLYLAKSVEWMGYPEFCHVVLHEAGHAANVGHRARGIMRPLPLFDIGRGANGKVVWGGVDYRCQPGFKR